MSTLTDQLGVGDEVELLTVPPGRFRLKAGQRGRVVLGEDGGLGWRLVAVDFGDETRPYQVHARHLRRIAAAPAAAEVRA